MTKAKEKTAINIHGDGFGKFMHEFVSETDRAAVILGAAKVEALLGQILDKYLLPIPGSADDLLEGDSPLSTLSSRIKICHRLGIIDDGFAKLLNTFRKLRNSFAHEITHSNLSVGSARDRVAAMADPFKDSKFFCSLVQKIADEMKRDTSDAGVHFRAVLAIFHLELERMHDGIQPAKPLYDIELVARALER